MGERKEADGPIKGRYVALRGMLRVASQQNTNVESLRVKQKGDMGAGTGCSKRNYIYDLSTF
jgi:hypothetical protein